jgi:hypothetical protein
MGLSNDAVLLYKLSKGEITISQLDEGMSQTAGGALGGTALAAGVSVRTGNGWTGRGPTPNQGILKQMADNLIETRKASGKADVGEATFGQGGSPKGLTPVKESVPNYGAHAEPQVSQFLPESGPRVYMIDQVPCPNCTLMMRLEGLFKGAVRVYGTENPAKPFGTFGGSIKGAALDSALGKIPGVRPVNLTPLIDIFGRNFIPYEPILNFLLTGASQRKGPLK